MRAVILLMLCLLPFSTAQELHYEGEIPYWGIEPMGSVAFNVTYSAPCYEVSVLPSVPWPTDTIELSYSFTPDWDWGGPPRVELACEVGESMASTTFTVSAASTAQTEGWHGYQLDVFAESDQFGNALLTIPLMVRWDPSFSFQLANDTFHAHPGELLEIDLEILNEGNRESAYGPSLQNPLQENRGPISISPGFKSFYSIPFQAPEEPGTYEFEGRIWVAPIFRLAPTTHWDCFCEQESPFTVKITVHESEAEDSPTPLALGVLLIGFAAARTRAKQS